MKIEVEKASHFLTNLLRVQCGKNINLDRLDHFCRQLQTRLVAHYQQHWFPESPCKGSGYRCIRINHKMDPVLSRAGSECGFDEGSLRNLFPRELTLWIDPREVSYRIGENGSICVLYESATSVIRPTSPWETPKRTGTRSIPDSTGSSPSCSESDDDSCSPMSTSPPSPKFQRPPSCKTSLMRDAGFIMDPRNISYDFPTYVAS